LSSVANRRIFDPPTPLKRFLEGTCFARISSIDFVVPGETEHR
jgi:hypothetical protein